jgi:hypothetical protein
MPMQRAAKSNLKGNRRPMLKNFTKHDKCVSIF